MLGSADPLTPWPPKPVTNAEFTVALANALHRPAVVPVPITALRLAFGEMSEILIASQRVFPKEAERTGYAFKYPELAGALAAALNDTAGSKNQSR
jgi:NAD dependent epimerase/dehydratase family enzyme